MASQRARILGGGASVAAPRDVTISVVAAGVSPQGICPTCPTCGATTPRPPLNSIVMVRHDGGQHAGLILSWSRSRNSALVRLRLAGVDADVRVQLADVIQVLQLGDAAE